MPVRTVTCPRRLLVLVAVSIALAAPALAAATPHRRAAGPRPESPIGAHSMLYLNTPFGAKQAMFAQAAAMGASEIRLDVELSAVFPKAAQPPQQETIGGLPGLLGPDPLARPPAENEASPEPDWSELDQYMELAREYHLRVLADLMSTPSYMADCPPGTPVENFYLCPPKDPHAWGEEAGEIALHTRGVIDDFEIINEPDRPWAFIGSPAQYATVLAAAYDAIHAADPNARVALGGLGEAGPGGRQWMDAVLATPGVDAAQKFDIANVHVRVPVTQVARDVCVWKSYFASTGFEGPLWVTETGYPADPAEQTEPGYREGDSAQSRWLTNVIPAMLAAGSAKVFVTERDWGTGPYASEGVLRTPNPLPSVPPIRRRPSFYAVQRLARGAWVAAARHARIAVRNACTL